MIRERVKLTSDLVEAFAGMYLSVNYDTAASVPSFHREVWEMYCSEHPQCACAAPRGHAKSTAFTLAYGLAVVLFREQDYVVILGSSEDMAVESLGELALELAENDDIIRDFGIKRFVTEQKTDIIVECEDGHQFRIVGRGAGQKIRGRKWRGKRPGLILFDDVEDDEQVESKEQRRKFRNWFFRAAKQALRIGGKIRGHGTILHEDSMLANLMKNPEWRTKLYKAHNGFDDFTNVLWPERIPAAALQAKQREMVAAGDGPGYSAEMLNDPLDNSDAFLRKDDFIPMRPDDFDRPMKIIVGCDFAVSKTDLANRTSFTVGGKDETNIVHHLDFYVGRWSATVSSAERAAGEKGWIDLMFEIDERWNPEVFYVEGGQIWNVVNRFIYEEMQVRDRFFNIAVMNPVKDKAVRARPLQKRHRAGATRWNKDAEGYASAEQEMLRFTGNKQSTLDDQFDSCATMHLGLDKAGLLVEEDFETPDEEEYRRAVPPAMNSGRSQVTGY